MASMPSVDRVIIIEVLIPYISVSATKQKDGHKDSRRNPVNDGSTSFIGGSRIEGPNGEGNGSLRQQQRSDAM